jgi:hypothetical protein
MDSKSVTIHFFLFSRRKKCSSEIMLIFFCFRIQIACYLFDFRRYLSRSKFPVL